MIQTSTDGGATWTLPASIFQPALDSFAPWPGTVVALPDGTALTAYMGQTSNGTNYVRVENCTPTSCATVASLPAVSIPAPSSAGFFHFQNLPGTRIGSYPTLAINDLPGGDQRLLLAWLDFAGGIGHILASVSSDSGHTWSAVKRVDPTATTDQFNVAVGWRHYAFGVTSAMACYYQRIDEVFTGVNVACTESRDGGQTWRSPQVLTSSPIVVGLGKWAGFLGDYTTYDEVNSLEAYTVNVVDNPPPTPATSFEQYIQVTTVACVGDCNGDGRVTIDEIVTMVNIALGTEALTYCRAGDANGDGQVTVNEITKAVNNDLNGCGFGGTASAQAATAPAVAPLTSGTITQQIGAASGARGSNVTIPVSIINTGGTVAGTQLDLLYATAVLTNPNCVEDPRIPNHSLSTSLPNVPPPPTGDTRLRTLLADLSSASTFTDGQLFSCTFTISPTAQPGTYSIVGDNQYVSDHYGNLPASAVTNGSVTVF